MKAKIRFLILFCLLMVLFSVSIASCSSNEGGPDDFEHTPSPDVTPPGSTGSDNTEKKYTYAEFTPPVDRTISVGYEAEYLDENVKRNIPKVNDGGLSSGYPAYGYTLSLTTEQKEAIQSENSKIMAGNGSYNAIDKDGYLLLNGERVNTEAPFNKLFKHSSVNLQQGLYYGKVSDKEPAVSKRITINPRVVGNYITGVYAPAGEVLKIEMSEEDLAATGGLIFDIGQCSFTGGANNIWNARDFNRMPWILSSLTISKTEGYIGSFLGGPVYVRPVKSATTFTFTISGGVKYPHYIHGYTTLEEYEKNLTSTAPYFDLEIMENGARHSGPRKYGADIFTYDQIVDAAVLWEKISTVSNQFPQGSKATIGINFLYDPFIAAGAAVAFVGANWVNCPPDWMKGSLDVEGFTKNGSWGNIHEYNHHYQNYGLPNGGEVTNNAASLVSYSLFTNISASRVLDKSIDWWNNYTDPGWVINNMNTLNKADGIYSLEAYANILHSFGQDLFIKTAKAGAGKKTIDGYYTALTETIGYDFSFYFKEVLNIQPSNEALEASKGLPLYIPAASTLQTGASFVKDGKTYMTQTARPYHIAANEPFTFDLNKVIKVPNGLEFNIKEIGTPKNGTLTKVSDGIYTYTPDTENNLSGAIYVTLELHAPNYGNTEVTLQLEFEPDSNYNPNILTKTTYKYASVDSMPDIETAINNNFKGASSSEEGIIDMSLGGMNGNAQVWFPEQLTITEYKGKLLFTEAGKWRIALRGRWYANLYLYRENGDFSIIKINNENLQSNWNDPIAKGKYIDVDVEANEFINFKVVLYNKNSQVNLTYASLGWGKFNNDSVSVGEVRTAYKEDYELVPTKTFDNPYAKTYKDTYSVIADNSKMKIVGETHPCEPNFGIERAFDGDRTTVVIAVNNQFATEDNPFYFTVDANQEFYANRITLFAYKHTNGKVYLPCKIRVWVGLTENNLELVGEKTLTDTNINADSMIFVEFTARKVRYYKVEILDMLPDHRYAAFSEVELSYTINGTAKLNSFNNDSLKYTGNWKQEGKLSPFGQINIGNANSTVEFTFTGTHFWLYSYFNKAYGTFEVFIDGKSVGTVNLSTNDNKTMYSFVSEALTNGKHTVKLVGKTGTFNIAAFATM